MMGPKQEAQPARFYEFSLGDHVPVRRQKNDANDAEAIVEASLRPAIRTVPVKSPEQQALAMLFRTRELLLTQKRCLKAFGERIMARDPDRQTAEIHIRIALMNRFTALGTAEIIRVA